MSNVVNLFEESEDPHIVGEGRCVQCGHEFIAVSPAGTTWVECPSCGSMKAFFKNPCAAAEGELQWVCSCGCEYFFITPTKVACANCGARQTPFNDPKGVS